MTVKDLLIKFKLTGTYIISIIGVLDGVEYSWANNYTGTYNLIRDLGNESVAFFEVRYKDAKQFIDIIIEQ